MYFCKVENFRNGKINEQGFSNPHPRTDTMIVCGDHMYLCHLIEKKHSLSSHMQHLVYHGQTSIDTNSYGLSSEP